MKTLARVLGCFLGLYFLANVHASAQCNGGCPWLMPKWFEGGSYVFDATKKVPGSIYDYQYDFGHLDVGLTAILKIKFTNCHPLVSVPSNQLNVGGSNVYFDISVTYCNTAVAADWDVTSLVDFGSTIPTIPVGGESGEFTIKFHPTTAGLKKALLAVRYSDPDCNGGNAEGVVNGTSCTLTRGPAANNSVILTFQLSGTGDVRQPLNSILVVDKSGSMADPAFTMTGSITKAQALQQALGVFYDVLDPQDNLAVVAFSSTASTIVNFQTKPSALPTEINTSSPVSGPLAPGGSTSIGAGLNAGIAISNLYAPPSGHKNILIVQTDGIQNTPPDALGVAIPSNATVYTVGLGPDVQDSYLQSLSGPSRFRKVTDLLTGPAAQELQNFYFKIFAQANNMANVTDPTRLINLSGGPVTAFTSPMTLADKEAYFLVIEGDYQRELYTTELVNPKGEVITSASNIGGSPVVVASSSGHKIYKVKGAIDNSFVGEWKLNVIPRSTCKDSTSCDVPVSFSSAAKSNLRQEMATMSTTYLPGSPIRLATKLTESRVPLAHANVVCTIKGPDKKIYNGIRLFDNGLGADQVAGDGIYSAEFLETSAIGTYEIKLNSFVKTLDGKPTTREDVQYVALQFPNDQLKLSDGGCFSCKLRWVFAVAVLLLLLFIIYRLRSR